MDEVSDDLFVSGIEAASDRAQLQANDITAVVSVTHESPDGDIPSGLDHRHLPMMDGPRNDREAFEQAVTEAIELLQAGERVLVHCSWGSSRSAAVAATAMALHRGRDIGDAFETVAAGRKEVDPHPELVRRAVSVWEDRRD
ncbi:dual specificity protein phosphatase [Haloarchaeobius sp. HME9146]|uniref:dual specificity protein phosphatase family protein n=1 Tax=Haloarchaeobius sp. HME9146 TaxID=2978732 RepID=UPI0021C08F8F|nr:dual specificity protein phosphatase [Haloarchaeobius sp. HME9146]MCT9098257.1 dual specificity protein phosphatase family protein [Haloarchaeobius sp. HME9146]